MDTVREGYRGLALILNINWDRILYPATIALALFAGAYLGSLAFPAP